jgi:hypothetical protein
MTWKYFKKPIFSGEFIPSGVRLFIKLAIPRNGIVTIIPTIINTRTDATITKAANISWEKGFISRKAVKSMLDFFVQEQRYIKQNTNQK